MSELLSSIRSKEGDVRLHPEDDTRIEMKRGLVPPDQWKVWKRTLIQNQYLVVAILREEQASRAWEESGRDPFWWIQ